MQGYEARAREYRGIDVEPQRRRGVEAATRGVKRDMDECISHVKRAFIMQNAARHADDTLIFRVRLVPRPRLG